MRPLRFVYYAVDGTGVGHLTRLLAIARQARKLARLGGVRVEAWFLTSSEADGMLFDERFASFKLPSKTSVADAGIDRRTYVALAKQWVWHSLGLLRPDLLVVDTFPRGSFGELLGALDLVKRKAFVYRPARATFAERADFQAMLPLYDAILVPEHERVARVVVPESAADRVSYVGPILSREDDEVLPRARARAELDLDEREFAVFVSTGGGGDPEAAATLRRATEAVLALPGAVVVAGAGPLFRGTPLGGARVRWLGRRAAAEVMRGFDAAVSASGYNTFAELMHAGVPTVFAPLEKMADDQRARAERAETEGAGTVLPPRFTADDLRDALVVYRDPDVHRRAAEAARTLVPRSHARDAAIELMRLVVPPDVMDRIEDEASDAIDPDRLGD